MPRAISSERRVVDSASFFSARSIEGWPVTLACTGALMSRATSASICG